MSKDKITTTERIYRNEPLGELLYDDGYLSVERTRERLVLKVLLEKEQNWLQLADQLRCEVACLSRWAWDKMCNEDLKNFSQLTPIDRDEELEAYCRKKFMQTDDPFLYAYFYDDYNWVIYEGGEDYLFLYEMDMDEQNPEYYLGQMDALFDCPLDDLELILMFLRNWYYRVNGYPEEKESDETESKS